MSEPVLTVFNRHSANCGQPPAYDTRDQGKYFGYFQSESGEQWLFVYDRDTKKAILKGEGRGRGLDE